MARGGRGVEDELQTTYAEAVEHQVDEGNLGLDSDSGEGVGVPPLPGIAVCAGEYSSQICFAPHPQREEPKLYMEGPSYAEQLRMGSFLAARSGHSRTEQVGDPTDSVLLTTHQSPRVT